jgi:hypothetical protein
MNCPKCGGVINPGESFCRTCGAQVGVVNNVGGLQSNPNVNMQPNPINNVQPSPMINVQPNPVNPGPMVQNTIPNDNQGYNSFQTPKSGNSMIIILGLLLVIAIGAAAYFYFNANNNNGVNNNDNVTAQSTVVNTGAYSISLPNDWLYKYDANQGALTMYDDSQEWQAVVLIYENTSYQSAVAAKASLAAKLTGLGYTVTSNDEQTVSGKKFLVIKGTTGTYAGAVVASATSSSSIALSGLDFVSVEAMNNNLNKILNALSTYKKGSNSSFISQFSNSKFTSESMNQIIDIAQ